MFAHRRTIVLLGLLSSSCLSPSSGIGDRTRSFSRSDLSRFTPYSEAGGNWRIEAGTLIGEGPAIQSVLVREGITLRDGWVEACSDRADDGGLVLRFRAPDDYYLLAFRDDEAPAPRGEQNLALYHRIGGQYREMWRRDLVWPRGAARSVRLEAAGELLRVYFANELVATVRPAPSINDPAPSRDPGGIGVRHYGSDEAWKTRFLRLRWGASAPASPDRERGQPALPFARATL